MKISKITSLILAGSAFALIGCGGGGGMVASNIVNSKTTKITASDAYIVALPNPATITLANGQSYATTKVDGNGTVVFDNLPADANLSGAKVYIPDTAIVDTDGDGQLSAGDQTIRMALSVKYSGDDNNSNIVANPLTTIAVDKNNSEVLKEMAHFDPVKAKLQLTQDYNETLAKEVALNDAVANVIKNAQENNESTQNVINSIDIDNLKNVINNPSIDVNTTLQTTLNNINDKQAIQKAVEVIELAKDIHTLVKDKKIRPHEGLIALIAVSDANVSIQTAKNALRDGNITKIISCLPKDEKVQAHIKKHEMDMDQDINQSHNNDMDQDINQSHNNDMNQDINQSHNNDMDQDINQSHNNDMDQDINQSHNNDMDQDINQSHTSNTEQNKKRD